MRRQLLTRLFPVSTREQNPTAVKPAWTKPGSAVRGYPLFSEKPWISLAQMPADDAYIYATTLTVLSGGAKGLSAPLDALRDSKISIGPGFGIPNMLEGTAENQAR